MLWERARGLLLGPLLTGVSVIFGASSRSWPTMSEISAKVFLNLSSFLIEVLRKLVENCDLPSKEVSFTWRENS